MPRTGSSGPPVCGDRLCSETGGTTTRPGDEEETQTVQKPKSEMKKEQTQTMEQAHDMWQTVTVTIQSMQDP